MTELYKLLITIVIIFHFVRDRLRTSDVAADGNANTPDTAPTTTRRRSFASELVTFICEDTSPRLLFNQMCLALCYLVVNFSVFGVFAHSTASNFFLLKASSPVVTAVMLVLWVSRPVSATQWCSVVAQTLGLVTAQVNLCSMAMQTDAAGYTYILLNIAVSCAAGVWNEHMIKSVQCSVNVQNFYLYIFGIIANVLLHYTPGALEFALGSAVAATSGSDGFFRGFTTAVVGVIVANGSVGLVITAVYRYADVVVKTFGLAGSSVVLFMLERMGFVPISGSAGPSFMTTSNLLGAMLIFYAAYVYILPASVVEEGALLPPPALLPGADDAATGAATAPRWARACNRYMALLITLSLAVSTIAYVMPC
jgi:hypothetical protein